MTDDESPTQERRSLTFTLDPEAEGLDIKYVLDDARNDDEWPSGEWETHWEGEVLRIHATAKALRWAYDWMKWAEDAYKLEDGKYLAKACRYCADRFWEELPEDPPEQQRPRRLLR